MRRAIVRITPRVLAEMLMGHEMSKVTTDLPKDAAIVDCHWDHMRSSGGILLQVDSAEFEEVPPGAIWPERDVVVTATWTTETAVYELLCPKCAEHHAKGHLP